MIRLFNYELSEQCYKLRLFMHFLRVEYETVAVDFYPGREHETAQLAQNDVWARLPVLEDGVSRLHDSEAILVYLAGRYDASAAWFPAQPAARAQVVAWFPIARDLTRTASGARLHDVFGCVLDVKRARHEARAIFRLVDDHLADREIEGRHWLAGEAPTLADIACFPCIALSHEGGIARDDFPAIRRWIDRMRHLDGFVAMPGILGPPR
ncbi:glutathione S-transferase family protein [Paraburkholderia sp. SOS3]|uniref:glutathione S-transferase family protein n=1 Tax=Paraburkholderia sp. SOS3 TaxID=1926494 RepID=UPI0009F9A33F|nr:glutathione binding-like protein [Paraburkholderia sp. SOS3]